MKFVLILLILFFLQVKADDEFGEDETQNDLRKVSFHENIITKNISIFSIRGIIMFDRYLFRPVSLLYGNVTTSNFQIAVRNVIGNISETAHVPDNILIFSHQRLISSFGYVLLNGSVGVAGTANFAKKFELPEAKTSVVDVLRFYNVPELYFISFAGIPLTLNTTLALPVEIFRGRYYSLSGSFLGDFAINTTNARALNWNTFDLALKLDPEIIYEASKTSEYVKAKYFKLERKPFKDKKMALQYYLAEREGF